MSLPLICKWQEALAVANLSEKAKRFDAIEANLYPLVIDMVEKWELENVLPGVTVENFPNASAGTGAAAIHSLSAWLITECQKVYNGNEDGDPNE
jgi:hypothetical protein